MSGQLWMANPFYLDRNPGDPGYDSRPWVNQYSTTHGFVVWIGVGGAWKRGLVWVGVGGIWQPTFNASNADMSISSMTPISSCRTNQSGAQVYPPNYGANANLQFNSGGTTQAYQFEWFLDTVSQGLEAITQLGAGRTFASYGYPHQIPDDGVNHVVGVHLKAQSLDGTWSAFGPTYSCTVLYAACGRVV